MKAEGQQKADQRLGLVLLLAGALIFLVAGIAWSRSASIAMGDFKVVYYSARCLMQNGDPYNASEVLRIYNGEGRESPLTSERSREVMTRFFYLPTAFVFTVPFALIGFAAGHVLWMILSAGGFVLAAVLAWDLSKSYAPVVSGALLGFLLMNSFWLLMIGNSAAIVVSFCVVAAWCFMRERLVAAGILSLALALALKPHDAGFVWLFFLLAGGPFRKRALQSIALFAVLSVPAFLWVMKVAPHWVEEIRANGAAFSKPGGITDPGIAGMAGKYMDSVVELQSVVSVFVENPRAYNLLSYGVCGALIAVWIVATLRQKPRGARAWMALAAIIPLSMLPVYHLQHDAKLLMLAVPGCALLWAEGGAIRWVGLALTGAGIGINGDIFSGIRIAMTHRFVTPEPNLLSRIATVQLTRPGPIVLLAMSVFYLWVYLKYGFKEEQVSVYSLDAENEAESMDTPNLRGQEK
jgi:hypothetical protein